MTSRLIGKGQYFLIDKAVTMTLRLIGKWWECFPEQFPVIFIELRPDWFFKQGQINKAITMIS